MTTFDLCVLIKGAIVRRTAEVICYTNWSDEFALSQIKEIPEWIMKSENFRPIQPSKLTSNQCKYLGFGKLTPRSKLQLIPLWLLPFLAEDITYIDINGGTVTSAKDIDNDTRYGILAYGIIPSKTKEINHDS